jgi:lytic murein transglycosylase
MRLPFTKMTFYPTGITCGLALAMTSLLYWPSTAFASTDGFGKCLTQLRAEFRNQGVEGSTFDAYRSQMVMDATVLDLLNRQPEFSTPIWDYLAALVDDERIADGLAAMKTNQAVIDGVAERWKIDPFMVAGVWGVESNFGRVLGGRPLLASLSTLACNGRRQAFFKGEFIAALKVLQQGHVPPEKLVGSWAGAFGQTQFMPSTFLTTAQDYDGDGRRDVVDNTGDALASTANFLIKAGWRNGLPWGFEVRLPKGFDERNSGRLQRKPALFWREKGILRVGGTPLLPSSNRGEALFETTPMALLIPAGANGPAFLVTRNFDALYAYNAAESYALAIAQLRDRMAGTSKQVAPWPTDDPGLSRVQRRQVQALLLARGYEIGVADGMMGEKTRHAVATVQRQWGVKADGRAGQKFLQQLLKTEP